MYLDRPEAPPRSRTRRAAECIVFVALWMAAGWLLHLGPEVYLLIGIPLTLAFQRFVARRPLPSLWVRGAAQFRLDRPGIAIALALAIAPGWSLVQAIRAGRPTTVAWCIAALAGAPAAAFAIRGFRRDQRGSLVRCLAIAGSIGSFTPLAMMVYRAVTGTLVLSRALGALPELPLFLPVCFVLEEVSFRGALDAHLHAPGEDRGILSAILISALWGLWHAPVLPPASLGVAPMALVVVVGCLVGVPLSIYWRKSGNLIVPALAHSLIDTVRDAAIAATRA